MRFLTPMPPAILAGAATPAWESGHGPFRAARPFTVGSTPIPELPQERRATGDRHLRDAAIATGAEAAR